MSVCPEYEQATNVLADRIAALIPKHPEILEMTDPFDLFDVEGFSCSDLDPSLGQASAALSAAKSRYNETRKEIA